VHFAKLQAVLKRFEDKLEKVKEQKTAELKVVEESVKAFST
jgi:hypothetical protein